ncbi:MAG TPA: hypothetical protein VFW44_06765, partial [Bryobacteraceae bacterium]|nr:hypothetical protein [Bryobacteraceae bacterium]
RAQNISKLHSSAAWIQAEEAFFKTGLAAGVQKTHSRMLDAIALDAYRGTIEPVLPQGAVLLAAGGYGKQEPFPYAAVDIMVLLEGESPWVSLREPLAECVRQLWDAGLRLNHTVRTISECMEFREQNIDLDINLLDLRYLAGDRALYSRLENKWPAFLEKSGPKLVQHLARHTRLRHAKYQNTAHHREPDVKDAPGGLRDWNLIAWLGRLGVETSDHEQLKRAGEFLSSVRCFLHFHSQSDRNLLDLESQQRLLAQPFARGKSLTEWMREYFRHASVIFNEARRALISTEKADSSLVGNFRDWRSRLSNSEFTVSRERIFLRNPAQLENDPGVVLRLTEFIGRHGIVAAPETERRLEAASAAFSAYCSQPRPLWGTLESVFALPRSAMALRTLRRAGMLAGLFPELAPVMDLVDTEPEQHYAVDEHTLIAVERATELATNTDPTRQRFAQLYSEIENPAVLLVALLFHSAGKGEPPAELLSHREPVSHAAALARQAMERIRVAAEDQREVLFLIEHQLDLAEVMSGRDIEDPATARQVAERVGTIERLKLLTVLTYADLAAISADSMTPWRMERLWRAYEITQHELTRELETDRIQDVPDNVPGRPAFLKGFPSRYLRAHSPVEIEAHGRLYEESRPTGIAVQLDRIEGAYRLTVIARDMPALFASFAGAISSFGLDILKAEAFSNARGMILDTFVFADPQRTLDLNPPESERLLDLIRRVALGKTDGQRLLRSRAQPDPKKRGAPPQVQFDSDACDTATLVEITAEDRPGLLYNLATVFSSTACNIDVVLIDTKGHRAIDVFYVAHNGQKLTPELQATLKEKLLAVC